MAGAAARAAVAPEGVPVLALVVHVLVRAVGGRLLVGMLKPGRYKDAGRCPEI